MRRVGTIGVLALVAMPALAAELAGVSMPDTVTVGGQTLTLNGMGVRKKLWVKVYVGGLYVAKTGHDAAALIKADTPKRMVMHFLYKEVEQAKLTAGWREGFANNSAAVLPTLSSRLDTFCSWWPAMKSGQRAEITYVPGAGTTLEIDGKSLGTVPGADFAEALFSVWLGGKPADAGLKEGLAGT
jgi:hypothetical protein